MNSQNYLWEITRYLGWFTSHVRLEVKSGNNDIAKYAEKFLIPILNPVFNRKFQRLEFVKKNYPAIDLGSDDFQISIQVTAEIGYDKLKYTISRFIEKELFKKYSKLIHLVIHEEYKTKKSDEDISNFIEGELIKTGIKPLPKVLFRVEDDLLNMASLRKLIEQKCETEQLKEIRDYLEKEYGKVTSLPYFDDILVPYEIAFKSQLDEGNDNLARQFHSPFFGRENDLKKLDSFINDSGKSVLALIGDGGYGKTRLAIEGFKKINSSGRNLEAYVLNEAAFHCLDFSEQIKTEKEILVLFDDAHNKPEILSDVISAAQRLPNVKLVLTIRKALYSETIKNVPTHVLIDSLELDRLSYKETQQLFKTHLQGLKEVEIKRLSEKSRGIPIVVLGLCQNMLKGKYKSDLSEEANFVQFVKQLKDQVISDIYNNHYISKENINKTIQLISFFGPVKNSLEEINALAKLNNLDLEETQLIIDYLNERDFVIKHREISIKPDVYSDTILLESIQRIKYLLKKDLSFFIDRLIRNLVELEHSQRVNLSVDNLLVDFISSIKKINSDSDNNLKKLSSNLGTLKSFTYKKPSICFSAVSDLIILQLNNNEFWRLNEGFSEAHYYLKKVHEHIEGIIAITSLNTHKQSEFEEIYKTMIIYSSKRKESRIFQEVFSYRVYDFIEYGYRPLIPCERQLFLIDKLAFRFENEKADEDLISHIYFCIQPILALEFNAESHYDKYTNSFTVGRHKVIFNETIKAIRGKTYALLIRCYRTFRHTTVSKKLFEELLKVLFYAVKKKRVENHFNRDGEFKMIIEFLNKILDDSPSIFEKSSVIKRLKLFERKELKKDYVNEFESLVYKSSKVETPKQKLELLIHYDYFTIRDEIKELFVALLKDYKNQNLFFSDLLHLKISLPDDGKNCFHEIINHIYKNYKEQSRDLLDFVINNYPEQISSFGTLIRANYKDQKYFYSTIEKIWEIEGQDSKGTVLWMLTFGRNQEINFYQEGDFKYIEYVIKNNLIGAIRNISFTLPKYIFVDSGKTIELITSVIKINKGKAENEHLLRSIFEDEKILTNYPNLIKDFMFQETMDIPLDSLYFDRALKFIDNTFGFVKLLDYLRAKLDYWEDKNDYFDFFFYNPYNNEKKQQIQAEVDFLVVLKWYNELTEKNDYLHKKLVEFLRPNQIQSKEFKSGFIQLIEEIEDDLERKVDLCSTLDVYEVKSEFLLSLLIEVSNELCRKYELTNSHLKKIFGFDFIENLVGKSGHPGIPFPQDLNKKDQLERIINEIDMHPKVDEVFNYALGKVNRDIENSKIRREDEKW